MTLTPRQKAIAQVNRAMNAHVRVISGKPNQRAAEKSHENLIQAQNHLRSVKRQEWLDRQKTVVVDKQTAATDAAEIAFDEAVGETN